MRTATLPARGPVGPLRSKRLLALAGDDRLVEQIRRGNERAFEVAFERYSASVLSFCRHMLGSPEEAEDAVQQTFASAYRALLQDDAREISLKPWLYTIARNRCLSMLRARRDEVHAAHEPATAGLAEQVEQRAELRQLLRDIGELPDEQRAALLLSETADLSHAEIADVLECEVPKVKALVFRARNSLLERRNARETPCDAIREQLAVLRGGSLRRAGLKHHLESCPGCQAYREDLRRQRSQLALILPVTPSLLLKSKVLGGGVGGGAAAGLTGGYSGAGVAAGLAGAGSSVAGGSALLAKVAVLALLAGGGAIATSTAIDGSDPGSRPANRGTQSQAAPIRQGADSKALPTEARPHASGKRGHKSAKASAAKAHKQKQGHGKKASHGSRGLGGEHRAQHVRPVRRGQPVNKPPQGPTPVKRGPVQPTPKATTPPRLPKPVVEPLVLPPLANGNAKGLTK